MKFKVGEKVKIVNSFFISKRAGMLGTVNKVYLEDKEIPYRIAMGKNWSCPVYEYEIEKVFPAKGQQLVFSFME